MLLFGIYRDDDEEDDDEEDEDASSETDTEDDSFDSIVRQTAPLPREKMFGWSCRASDPPIDTTTAS